MHLQPAQTNIFQFGCPGINGFDFFKGDAEFVLIGAGGDLGVSVGVNIRIYANGDGSDLFFRAATLLIRSNSGSLSTLKE